MTSETYRNAPITEAALDIRVRVPKGVTADVLAQLKDEKYTAPPDRRVNVEVQVKNEEGRADAINTLTGYAYKSSDGRQLFQARTDGFTHNRLAPYESWPMFVAEARRLWQEYKAFVRPDVIELLGLNYVNHILVPDGTNFSDYLRVYLEIPSELPQQLNTFSLGFQANWPGQEGILTYMGQAIGPMQKEGFVTVVLSIQAFKPLQEPAALVDEEFVWTMFEKLRDVKNSVFEACITDRVREEIR